MDQRQWKSHHVEVIAFDPGNEYTSITLNGVRTGLIENIFALKVLENVLVGERREPDACPLDSYERFFFRLVHDRHGGQHRVIAARELPQHPDRIVFVLRLSQDLTIDG